MKYTKDLDLFNKEIIYIVEGAINNHKRSSREIISIIDQYFEYCFNKLLNDIIGFGKVLGSTLFSFDSVSDLGFMADETNYKKQFDVLSYFNIKANVDVLTSDLILKSKDAIEHICNRITNFLSKCSFEFKIEYNGIEPKLTVTYLCRKV